MSMIRADDDPRKGPSTDQDRNAVPRTPLAPSAPEKPPGDFAVTVADYVQADWHLMRPRPPRADARGRKRTSQGIHGVIHQAVLAQKSSRVIVPDVVLAQVVWGERRRWNPNWRHRLVGRLKKSAAGGKTGVVEVVHREADRSDRTCPEVCALHGSPVKHHHLEITIRTLEGNAANGFEPDVDDPSAFDGMFLGALEVFGEGDPPERTYHWNPRPLPEEEEDDDEMMPEEREAHEELLGRVKRLKRSGRLTAVYLPMILFGASARCGLTFWQRQLHQAVTRELTRSAGGARSGRPDRAEVFIAGAQTPCAIAACPYLEPGGRYVSFNGNGKGNKKHLRGRGYRLVVWIWKAGYPNPEDRKAAWKQVARSFRHLEGLAETFGLVIAAWHPKQRAWRPLPELRPMIRSSAGRAWLRGCLLRVYTREDFLPRWRRLFAERMGFAAIPAPGEERPVEVRPSALSREGFIAYLQENGVSQAQFARELGVSKALVSQHLSGKRRWTDTWEDRVQAWVASRVRGVNSLTRNAPELTPNSPLNVPS